MKEPCTWLENLGFAQGALIGPNDQGQIAYRVIREAELALCGSERPIWVPRNREVENC